jgi:5-formyltetrahydrofolate cyclo-ligase
MKRHLRLLSADEITGLSLRVRTHLMANADWLSKARVVTLFGGLTGEPDLLPLIPLLIGRGVSPAFLAVEQNRLQAHRVHSTTDLKRGLFGVWEPNTEICPRVETSDISVILTPGLAFSPRNGARLGRGAGFYDRFFASPECKARRVGVGFDLQLTATIPTEPHDAPLHDLVTESGWQPIPQT